MDSWHSGPGSMVLCWPRGVCCPPPSHWCAYARLVSRPCRVTPWGERMIRISFFLSRAISGNFCHRVIGIFQPGKMGWFAGQKSYVMVSEAEPVAYHGPRSAQCCSLALKSKGSRVVSFGRTPAPHSAPNPQDSMIGKFPPGAASLSGPH